MGAWRKVKKETIVNCFSKCGFNEATLELFIDDDADAEFAELKNYISEISPDSTVDSYLNQDEDAVTSVDTVDILSMNWREDMMEKSICFAIEEGDETEKQAEADDDFDIERPELKIRSSQAALSIADDLNNFCETLGDAELVSVLSLVTRRLETLCNLIVSYMNTVIHVSSIYLMTHSFNRPSHLFQSIFCNKKYAYNILTPPHTGHL